MRPACGIVNATGLAASLVVLVVGCGSSLSRGSAGSAAGGGTGTGAGDASGSAGAMIGGAGGVAGLGAGGGGTPADCGAHQTFSTEMRVSTVGPIGNTTYEGRAVVERSTPTELVLAFQPDGMTLPMHARLFGVSPMPRLPLRYTVWLSKNPASDQVQPAVAYGSTPWSIVVRNGPGGRLLFATVWKPGVLTPSPIRLGDPIELCTVTDPYPCNATGTVVYSSVDVYGDSVVTIPDSGTKTVALDGVDYDVRISAQQEMAGTAGTTCGDFYFYIDGGVAIDIRARYLDNLTGWPPEGVAPDCSDGNDDGIELGFSVYNVDTTAVYDGPVFYRGRGANPACLEFDLVGLTSATGAQPTFEACPPAGVLAEPAPGQEFWLSRPAYWETALRGPQRGPVLLAAVSAYAPFDADTTATLDQVLGIHTSAEPRCAYADDGTSLYDLVFATAPATRVPSRTTTTVRIGDQDRTVWFSGQGTGVWFVIY